MAKGSEIRIKKDTAWKVAVVVLAIIVLYLVFVKEKAPAVPTVPGAIDTSSDPKVTLTIINDPGCSSCDVSQALSVLQGQLFPSLEIKEIDYTTPEGKKMAEDLDIIALPAYVFDDKITKTANFQANPQLQAAFIVKGNKFIVNPAAIGAGKYLNPPKADDDAVKGSKDAPVEIIEFSDFQCPFCRAFWRQTLPKLEKNYIDTGKVKFVYRDFPLAQIHPTAQKAAEAAECAEEQNKYWEYHDKVFEEQEKQGQGTVQFTAADLKQWAADLGLDTAKFNKCLDSGKYQSEVEKDMQDGISVGVSGTPAFFINGIPVSGAQPFEVFKEIIDAELSK